MKTEESYLRPKNAKEEMRSEAHLSFLGFTIFDIGHILLAIIVMVASFIKRDLGWEEDISEAIIELIFAGLLMTFVDALANSQNDVVIFRKNYSYAFICASAALLVPLSLSIPVAIQFSGEFTSSLCTTIAFFVTVAAVIFFFVGMVTFKNHVLWRAFNLVGAILFGCYVPFALIAYFANVTSFSWEVILSTIHYLIPIVPAIIAIIRLARHARKSALY